MEIMTQSSNQEITSFLEVKNKVKYSPSLLDKASRYFETNVGQKYGYKIINIIDVDGLRIVMAEDSNLTLYAISLIIIQGSHNGNPYNQLTLSDIGSITKHIAKQYEAIPSSSFIEID
jgi:hypothetical protein